MMQQDVGNMAMLTGQEHIFMGSTPHIIPPVGSIDWYIPQGLLMGTHTMEAVRAARTEKGYMSNPVIGIAIKATRGKDEVIGFKLEEIDVGSRMTKHDPRLIMGRWDDGSGQLIGRDVTGAFFAFYDGLPDEEKIYVPMRGEGARQPEKGIGHPERA